MSHGNNEEFLTQHLDGITLQLYSYELTILYSLSQIFPVRINRDQYNLIT